MTEITPALGLSAYLLGRRIAGQRRKPERVPVAYLYNGMRFPPIPKHDGMSYELMSKGGYAVGGGTAYYAWVTTAPWQKIFYGCSIQSGSSGYCYIYSTDTGNWERVHNWEERSPFDTPITPTWANHDVMNSDGTLYLAASEAVPIYE